MQIGATHFISTYHDDMGPLWSSRKCNWIAILQRALTFALLNPFFSHPPHSASHVVLQLVKKYPKYKIVNLDRLDYCACLENLDSVKMLRNYKFVKGNICSSDLINYLLEEEEIDTIMHFAAQTHVGKYIG